MDYDLILLGATAFSCGALEAGGRTLCIERGVLLAQEFCQGYASTRLSAPKTAAGRVLYEDLSVRGLTQGERVHCPPVADVLAHRLREKGASIWLQAEVVDISCVPGGFQVDVLAVDGLRSATARRVIDTTSEGLWRCARQLADYKMEVRVPLIKTDGCWPSLPEGVHVEYGALEDEAILCVPVDKRASWPARREALHGCWRELYRQGVGWKLAAEPVEAAVLYEAPVRVPLSAGWEFCPSVSWGDLICAFEEGSSCVF